MQCTFFYPKWDLMDLFIQEIQIFLNKNKSKMFGLVFQKILDFLNTF